MSLPKEAALKHLYENRHELVCMRDEMADYGPNFMHDPDLAHRYCSYEKEIEKIDTEIRKLESGNVGMFKILEYVGKYNDFDYIDCYIGTVIAAVATKEEAIAALGKLLSEDFPEHVYYACYGPDGREVHMPNPNYDPVYVPSTNDEIPF